MAPEAGVLEVVRLRVDAVDMEGTQGFAERFVGEVDEEGGRGHGGFPDQEADLEGEGEKAG